MVSGAARLPQAALRVADLQAAVHFYCGGLGFWPVLVDDPAGVALVEGPGGASLLLATAAADLGRWPGVRQPAAGAWVYLHHPDLSALAAELQEHGVAGVGPHEPYPGFRYLLATDPDGYEAVFWESLPLTDAEVVAIYRDGPARLAAALAGLTPAGLNLPRAPGKWTIRQIVHHLVDADLGTLHVLRLALGEPGRQVQTDVWDPDDLDAGLRSAERPVEPAVALLTAARAWVGSLLDCLPGALDRSVTWPSGYRAEVRRLLQQVGGHALHHIGQIEQVRHRHGL